MRVSKQTAADNRRRILAAAARLFREQGIDARREQRGQARRPREELVPQGFENADRLAQPVPARRSALVLPYRPPFIFRAMAGSVRSQSSFP